MDNFSHLGEEKKTFSCYEGGDTDVQQSMKPADLGVQEEKRLLSALACWEKTPRKGKDIVQEKLVSIIVSRCYGGELEKKLD